MRFTSPINDVKGVGEQTEAKLGQAGIETVEDLIYFLPRTYEDYSEVSRIDQLSPGNVVIRGKIERIVTKRVRRGLTITEAVLVDDSGRVPVVWFNQPYRMSQIQGKTSTDWLVSGEFAFSGQRYQLLNPSLQDTKEAVASEQRIVPVYRQVAGIKTQAVQKIIQELRPLMQVLPETLPAELASHESLLSHAEAIERLHFPESRDDIRLAKDRIAFEEVAELLYAAQLNRQDNQSLKGHHIPFDVEDAKQFISQLPFRLTDAQRVAAWEIVQNFGADSPMNRLLQGDVGSGKTVVAAFAAYIASRSGFQTAIMAPTELLARQHADTISALLTPLGVSVGLLIGSIPKAAKLSLKENISNGSIAVTVGTHALIQETVTFQNLGFVVIDEQHRFGVGQRQALLSKSNDHMPHLLAMTATPIPRSLQLTVYGELDISLLRERPKGRKPIITHIESPNSRAQLYETIDKILESGQQAYVICPLITDTAGAKSGDAELKSVEAEIKVLQKGPFKHRRIGKLHGKMSADEKQTSMEAFSSHQVDILVSTTVVEVGVDVPNATVIVIEGAERFGLAQLHQLRGRVGRSDLQAYCYLIPSTSAAPSQRLREMERSNDGFYLAEKDLELRGPGEIYGRAQHGELNLQVANIADTVLLQKVRRALLWCASHDLDLLQYSRTAKHVDAYRRLTTLN